MIFLLYGTKFSNSEIIIILLSKKMYPNIFYCSTPMIKLVTFTVSIDFHRIFLQDQEMVQWSDHWQMRLFRGEERVTVQPGRGQWTDGLQSVSRQRQSPYLLLSLMGEVVRRLYICFILNSWVKPPSVCVCAVLEQPDWDDVELKKASCLQWVS